jgi:hypothetical protein
MLDSVAEAFGPDLRRQMVFVGGCTTALFITDPVSLENVRSTDDVDVIVELLGYADWVRLQDALRARGFIQLPELVTCRFRFGTLKVDVMPDDETILGFSNRWYARGIAAAVGHRLASGREIRRLTPELFVATKIEAFLGRGHGDLLGSHDMEDILIVVDGREELVAEIAGADPDIRAYLAQHFRALSTRADFEHFIEGNVREPEGRADIVRERFLAISRVDEGLPPA